jgi:multidrug efflux system membrane fusion protein
MLHPQARASDTARSAAVFHVSDRFPELGFDFAQGAPAMNPGRKIVIACLAGIAVVAAVVGSMAWKNGKMANALASQKSSGTAARPIELIYSELFVTWRRPLVDTVRFTGTTQPIDQTIVKSRIAGQLGEVLVREGDKVSKDQVLARFEGHELQAKVNERESALEAARAEARWAARDYTDKETLAGRNIVSRASLDAARAMAESKASMVEVSQAQLDVVRKYLFDTEVRAPFDGIVGDRIANQGESLPINAPIVTLLDTSRVEVIAQMPAADVVRLKVDQLATLTLEGFGNRQFNGRITRISPTTQVGSRSIPVYVEITDQNEALRGGLFATGTVVVQEVADAFAVPRVAVRKDGQGDFVLAVIDGVLVRKPVEIVRTWSRGELVEVHGLETGVTIIAAALRGLKTGQAVKVLEIR